MFIRSLLGRTVFHEADTGAAPAAGASTPPAAPAAPAPQGTPAPAPAAPASVEVSELATLKAQLLEAQGKLTAKDQAEAETARKTAEEQGNFKSLYEQTQAALKTIQDGQAVETARQQRISAAREAGLDETLADRLIGVDDAALLADARALALRLTPAAPGTGPTNNGTQRTAAVGTAEEQINSAWGKRGKRGGIRFG